MLVDIQNLAGTLCLTANDVQWVRDAVTQSEVVPLRTQIVVACHRRNVAVVAFGWRNARILSAGRPAVRSLVQTIEDDGLAKRFGHVIVGSGDGRLAVAAAGLASGGVRVRALVGRGALSARLRLACHDVSRLTEAPTDVVYGGHRCGIRSGITA